MSISFRLETNRNRFLLMKTIQVGFSIYFKSKENLFWFLPKMVKFWVGFFEKVSPIVCEIWFTKNSRTLFPLYRWTTAWERVAGVGMGCGGKGGSGRVGEGGGEDELADWVTGSSGWKTKCLRLLFLIKCFVFQINIERKKLNLTRKKEIGVLHSYDSNDRAEVVAQVVASWTTNQEVLGLNLHWQLIFFLYVIFSSFFIKRTFQENVLKRSPWWNIGLKGGKMF